MTKNNGKDGVSGPSIYHLEDVVVSREKGGFHFCLKIPKFEAQRASFTAIVGQSGCGKSTLLDVLGLVLLPDDAKSFCLASGKQTRFDVSRMGPSALAATRRHHIGYILQSGGLMPFLSVAGNLRLARMLNPKAALGRVDAEKVVRILGLEGQIDKKPAHLSGGQRQRAAIARAVIQNPEALLADEPTGAVDRFTATQIRDLLLEECARKRGMAVVVVTHDEELVTDCADAVYTFATTQKEDGLDSVLFRKK